MHNNAFGINFPKEELNTVIQKCNEMCPLDSLCTIHQVDWQIPATKLKKKMVQEVADNYAIWGNGISVPLFVITDLHIIANQINGYGDNYGFIRFNYNGITFVKKYCPIGDYDKMTMKGRNTMGVNKKPLVLNIIGQFVLNAWEDKINPEVKILYYDVREDTGEEIDSDFDKIIVPKTEPKNQVKKDMAKVEKLNSKEKIQSVDNIKTTNKVKKEVKDIFEDDEDFGIEKKENKKVIKKVTMDDDFDF